MSAILDYGEEEDDGYRPEWVTDPVILRYARRLQALSVELLNETEHYTLNKEQIEQFTAVLYTLPLVFTTANDLATLDAMLGMTFPLLHYTPENDVIVTLTTFPLSGTN